MDRAARWTRSTATRALAAGLCVALCACADDATPADGGDDAADLGVGDGAPPEGGVDGAGQLTITPVGPPGGYVATIRWHPTDSDHVYAGLDDSGGLFESSDRGASWQPVSLGRQNWSAWEVVIDPQAPQKLIVADAYGHGVLRSDDGGASWGEGNGGLAAGARRRVRALAIDPQIPSTLYLGSADGLFKSEDGGLTWQQRSSGLPELPGQPGVLIPVERLAVDPATPTTVFAGLRGGWLFKSEDGGASWALAHGFNFSGAPEYWDLQISPSDPQRIVVAVEGRVAQSEDGGDSWSRLAEDEIGDTTGLKVGISATYAPDDADVLYIASGWIGGDNVRLRSEDGGQSFVDITGDRARDPVFRLRVNPHDASQVVAGLLGNGIDRSGDRGATWTRHAGAPRVAPAPGCAAVAPSDPQRIYLAGGLTLAVSGDGGQSWQRATTTRWYWTMAVDPHDAETVLLAPHFAFATRGLVRSTDGLRSTTHLPASAIGVGSGITSIRYSAAARDVVYITTFAQVSAGGTPDGRYGVFRSDDGGASFTRLTPTSWYDARGAFDLREHPTEPGALLVATSDGLWQSDAGQSEFTQLALAGESLAALDVSGDLWVAGGFEGKLFVSDDGGGSWQTTSFPETTIQSLLVDPARPGRVLAAVSAADVHWGPQSAPGLYLSDDSGASFSELTADLEPADQVIRVLSAGVANDYLFVVYSGAGGLYRAHVP